MNSFTDDRKMCIAINCRKQHFKSSETTSMTMNPIITVTKIL